MPSWHGKECTMHSNKKSIFINSTPEKIYAFARDPLKWGQWYANLSEIKLEKGDGGVGSVINSVYNLFGMHVPTIVEVTEDVSSPELCRWAGLIKGNITGKQIFTYTAKDGGTEVEIELEYTLPAGIIGRIADKLLIEKVKDNDLVHTLENLKAFCEG
jgi:uncharacterized membrane protein